MYYSNLLKEYIRVMLDVTAGDFYDSYPDYWADYAVYERKVRALLEEWHNYVSVVRQPKKE